MKMSIVTIACPVSTPMGQSCVRVTVRFECPYFQVSNKAMDFKYVHHQLESIIRESHPNYTINGTPLVTETSESEMLGIIHTMINEK